MKKLMLGFTISVFMIFMHLQNAAAVLIDFDDVASGTNIDTHYSGVTFSCVFCPANGDAFAVDLLGADPNGNGVSLHSADPTFAAEEGAVKVVFSTLQSNVSIDARGVSALEIVGTNTRRPFLEAFDSSDNFLGIVYDPYTYTDLAFYDWQTLTISRGSADISYVYISSQANCQGCTRSYGGLYGEFDNLNYSGGTNGGGNDNGGGTAVPEPSSLLLLGFGILALGFWGRGRFNTV